MPRKFKSFEHYLKPDAKFGSLLVTKFINCMMYDGKKSVALKLFYDVMDKLKEKFPKNEPLEVFTTAVNNVKPQIEVRSRRVGGATYQVPVQVDAKRQTSLAIRWILISSRSKKGRPMADRLAAELGDAFNREGESMKKRENIHKMAEANRAFSHFAW